jgi:hypothetical protein
MKLSLRRFAIALPLTLSLACSASDSTSPGAVIVTRDGKTSAFPAACETEPAYVLPLRREAGIEDLSRSDVDPSTYPPGEMRVVADTLYYSNGKGVFVVDPAGPRAIAIAPSMVDGIHTFWIEGDQVEYVAGTSIFSAPLSGGAPRVLVTASGVALWDAIFVKDASHFNWLAGDATSHLLVQRAPLLGGVVETLATLTWTHDDGRPVAVTLDASLFDGGDRLYAVEPPFSEREAHVVAIAKNGGETTEALRLPPRTERVVTFDGAAFWLATPGREASAVSVLSRVPLDGTIETPLGDSAIAFDPWSATRTSDTTYVSGILSTKDHALRDGLAVFDQGARPRFSSCLPESFQLVAIVASGAGIYGHVMSLVDGITKWGIVRLAD